jgi:hypothetical protein
MTSSRFGITDERAAASGAAHRLEPYIKGAQRHDFPDTCAGIELRRESGVITSGRAIQAMGRHFQ